MSTTSKTRSVGAVILTILAVVAGILAVIDVLRYLSLLPAVTFGQMNFFGFSLFGALLSGLVAVIWFWAASKLWNQIKADVLGIPYVQLSRGEFAVLGAAIVAGYAVGVFTDLKATASGFVHPTSRVEPRVEHHEFYKPLAELYAALIRDTKPLFQRLSQIPTPPQEEN